jgi:hypothetical protein
MFIPDLGSEFFHPGSQIPNPGSGSAAKNLRIFNPKSVCSKKNDLGSRITDHGSRISDHGLRIPDPGSRIPDPGSRNTTRTGTGNWYAWTDSVCTWNVPIPPVPVQHIIEIASPKHWTVDAGQGLRKPPQGARPYNTGREKGSARLATSAADPVLRIRYLNFPSRIQGQNRFQDPVSSSKNLCTLTPKIVSKLSKIWFGSGSWFFTHPRSRIQGSKRHRILDPKHCLQQGHRILNKRQSEKRHVV